MRKNGMDMHTFSRTNILSFTKAFECRVIKLSPDLYGSFFLPKVSSFLPSLRILSPQKTIFDQKVHFGKLKDIDLLDFIRNLLIRGLVLTGYMEDFNISQAKQVPKS